MRPPPYPISTTRPSLSVTRRSIRAARSRLWVATSAATRLALTSEVSVSKTWSAVLGSRLPVGSSASRTRGALASARASATRCCSPPDSSAGRWLSRAREAEEAEQLARPRRRFGALQAGDHLRQDDVLQRREFRQQVMELIDEADLRPAQRRAALLVHRRGRMAADMDLAGVLPFEQAGDVQQRRLAGARRRDQRHRLAGLQRQLGAVAALRSSSRRGRSGARSLEPQHRLVTHSAAPRPDRAAPPATTDRSSPAATG